MKRIPIPLSSDAVQQLTALAERDQRSISGMAAIIYRMGVDSYLESKGEINFA